MSEHPSNSPEQSILYADLSPEVRSYVDNLRTQISDLLKKYGITATNLQEAADALAAQARENTKQLLPDLRRFNDLLTALNTIRETGDLPPEAKEQEFGLPYERWSGVLNPLLLDSLVSGKSPELCTAFPGIESSQNPIEFLLASQEDFYRVQYGDPTFTIDRSKLRLSKERFTDIRRAIERGEVDYPLVVAPPHVLTPEEQSDPNLLPPDALRLTPPARTLHRVLFDSLIRENGIEFWERTDPDLNTFLDQVRDLTLADLTRNDLLGPDKEPLTFDEGHWLQYLQSLYPTLPRPTVTTATPTIGFVKWEGDPPSDRPIPPLRQGSAGQAGTTASSSGASAKEETIGNKSQLDAVRLHYPLATPSQWLTLFAQYHAKTGKPLDDLTKQNGTWSWLFGIIDPTTASDRPSVGAYWDTDGLHLYRDPPGDANTLSRLRSSR